MAFERTIKLWSERYLMFKYLLKKRQKKRMKIVKNKREIYARNALSLLI